MTYYFRDMYIPDRMQDIVDLYVDEGRVPGDFLKAVLVNDLKDAVGRADDENIKNIPAYIGYLYNECPGACWGSKENVIAWVKAKTGQEITLR